MFKVFVKENVLKHCHSQIEKFTTMSDPNISQKYTKEINSHSHIFSGNSEDNVKLYPEDFSIKKLPR